MLKIETDLRQIPLCSQMGAAFFLDELFQVNFFLSNHKAILIFYVFYVC